MATVTLPTLLPCVLASGSTPFEAVYRNYVALTEVASLADDSGLGGKLILAGALESASGMALVAAANIAGAASLVASSDAQALRQALRDGVVDFLVNSLEEALRILKNEVRKRQAVSVAAAVSREHLIEEMTRRGVLPDLLPPDGVDTGEQRNLEAFVRAGAKRLRMDGAEQQPYVTWSVDQAATRWLPQLDGCARAVIPAEDGARHRWLRLAPRYLGRQAQRQHGVGLNAAERGAFEARVSQLMTAAELGSASLG